ncbi:small integral membrane protein 26-like [Puntigrus tetrazona]|uniref:small integral membrane protein 26-like n=1 Tax=Puntigrus tetrazona TaxID=1606681 RepID=UPI001C8A3AB1|nr:small integral membrane protein 26-like [Puntigrus tetrazona]
MKVNPDKWYRNASMLYAIGVWTVLGSLFCKYRFGDNVAKVEQVDDDEHNVEVYETKYTRTTIIYKKDSVPYSTMLLNYINSKFGSSKESQKQEDGK